MNAIDDLGVIPMALGSVKKKESASFKRADDMDETPLATTGLRMNKMSV